MEGRVQILCNPPIFISTGGTPVVSVLQLFLRYFDIADFVSLIAIFTNASFVQGVI